MITVHANQATSNEIERLSRERQGIWDSGGGGAGEVAGLTSKLAALFEERRAEDARSRFGDRDSIVRRAKVETELERLVTG